MTGLFLFSVLLAWSSASSPGQPDHLNHHNDDSDVFYYNPCCLVAGHQRVVQGWHTELDFSFQAFGRIFDLNLFPEKSDFSSTPTVHYSDGSVQDVDVSHLYRGTVRGVPGSSVYLSVLDGQVEGYIILPGETAKYYIQPVKCRLSGQPSDTHVHDQTQAAETDGGKSQENPECSAEDCFKLQVAVELSSCDASSRLCRSCSIIKRMPAFFKKWIPCGETCGKVHYTWFRENVCNLHLIADPTLWRHFKYVRFGAVLTDKKTSEEIKKFFTGLVSTLKRIFVDTEFTTNDGREMFRGIDFELDHSTIMTDTTEKCNSSRPNVLCSSHLTVNELKSFSYTMDTEESCLAIVFTYRDFTEYLASASTMSPYTQWGGICADTINRAIEDEIVYKPSGNVIWLTLLKEIGFFNDEQFNVIFAQVVGHSFGSPFDDELDCALGESRPGGNYLMCLKKFGFQNLKFSSCSKDNITRFLSNVVYSRHGRRNCLKPSASGEGLLHRIFSPKISPDKRDSKLPKYDSKLNDEL